MSLEDRLPKGPLGNILWYKLGNKEIKQYIKIKGIKSKKELEEKKQSLYNHLLHYRKNGSKILSKILPNLHRNFKSKNDTEIIKCLKRYKNRINLIEKNEHLYDYLLKRRKNGKELLDRILPTSSEKWKFKNNKEIILYGVINGYLGLSYTAIKTRDCSYFYILNKYGLLKKFYELSARTLEDKVIWVLKDSL